MKFVNTTLGILFISTVYFFLLAVPLRLLWNFALVPAIDGINYIGYWQAVCIMFISTMLFKNSSIKKDKDE